VEGVDRMEPKEKPAPLHIRVVQRIQPSKTFTVNLGIEYSQCQDDLDIVWEANIAQARGWKGSQQRCRVRPCQVFGKIHFTITFINCRN
jgi:hypothetical protein